MEADIEPEETDFGARLFTVRPAEEGKVAVEIRSFMLPCLSGVAAVGVDGYTVQWHVPIDDTHHWKYLFRFSRQEPFPPGTPPWRYETRDYRPVHGAAVQESATPQSNVFAAPVGVQTMNFASPPSGENTLPVAVPSLRFNVIAKRKPQSGPPLGPSA